MTISVLAIANKLRLTISEIAVLTVDIPEEVIPEVSEIEDAWETLCSNWGLDPIKMVACSIGDELMEKQRNLSIEEATWLDDRINKPFYGLDDPRHNDPPPWAERA